MRRGALWRWKLTSRKWSLPGLLVVLAVALSTPLHAQTYSVPLTSASSDYIGPPYEPAVPPDSVAMPAVERGRYTLNSYGACLVHRNRKGVETTLRIPVGTKASHAAEAKLSVDDCLGSGEMRMDDTLLRGALFRALYRIDFWRNAPALSPQDLDFAADMEPNSQSASYIALHRYAECIARTDPGDARAVLMSGTASAKERAALSSLSPAFSTCLAKGSQLKFSKAILLGLLAEVLFRLSAPATAS